MPVQTLSKDAEDKVIEAVKQAVVLVDDQGLSPNDALEKVARAEKWGHDMIRFAGHAYNTGRQTAQREQSTNAFDKFADFPLADPEAVIGRIWPAQVKAANEAVYDNSVSDEYSQTPGWLSLKAADAAATRNRQWVEKAAADHVPKPAPPRLNPAADAWNNWRSLKTAADEARHQAGSTYDRLLDAMGQLGEYFRKAAHDRMAFATVRRLCQVKHGASVDKLFDYVATRNKQAKVEPVEPAVKLASLIEYNSALEPWSLVERCLSLGRRVAEKRAEHTRAVDAADAFVREHLAPYIAVQQRKKQGSDLLPQEDRTFFRDEDLRPFLCARPVQKQASLLSPSNQPGPSWTLLEGVKAGGAFDLAGTKKMLDETLGGLDNADKDTQSTWLNLEDPAHDAQLRQIRTQVLLADLMNDDAIGQHDPAHVMKAYNEISQMAPRTSQQPMAVRTLLRRHLQGNMEPFETKEIADLENKVKDTTQDTPQTRTLREAPASILS